MKFSEPMSKVESDDIHLHSSIHPQSIDNKAEVELSCHRVLIVDDTEENINYMERVLDRVGIVTQSAMSGLEALSLIRDSHTFDLIFMDVQMPIMDGITTLNALRKKGISTPVIAVTASNLDQLREKMEEIEFDGYLTKPSMVQDILAILAIHLPETKEVLDDV
jgi:two-component system sensor histidine kinase BarA